MWDVFTNIAAQELEVLVRVLPTIHCVLSLGAWDGESSGPHHQAA